MNPADVLGGVFLFSNKRPICLSDRTFVTCHLNFTTKPMPAPILQYPWFVAKRVVQHTVASIVLALLFTSTATAIPQFTALTGNRCGACHVSPAGGGLRTVTGWYARSDVSLIPASSPALSWLYGNDPGNSYADGTVLLGMNLRAQSTRSFAPGSERTTFPMQAAIHASWQPIKALTTELSFNAGALRSARYAGQAAGQASVMWQPIDSLPMIRVGYFRPSVGMYYDDHTIFARSWVQDGRRQTFMPPVWSEVGAELTYDTPMWLTLQAGVFGTGGLGHVQVTDGTQNRVRMLEGDGPTITGRAVIWPTFNNKTIVSWLGASAMVNGSFSMLNAFAGIGLSDHLSLMLDVNRTRRTDAITSTTFMTELMWQVHEAFLPYVRWEQATTSFVRRTNDESITSTIIGAQVFPIPYVELRPEYRIWDTDLPELATRWNLQLHIYY
jgi:hypothetical protein